MSSTLGRVSLAVQGGTSPPINRCIYCGTSAPPLTDEHIIPEGIGGKMILSRASCKTCARETCRFETIVQQHMMWPLRRLVGLSSPKRKPKPQIRIPSAIGREGPVHTQWREMNPDEAGLKAVIPTCRHIAGLLTGAPKEAPPQVGFITAAVREHARGWDELGNVILADFDAYFRMLAKIAHAQTVADAGLEAFEPFLNDFILGREELSSRYIGAAINNEPLLAQPYLHWAKMSQGFGGILDGLLIVRVHLFASLGLPAYDIVTGRWRRSP